MSTQKFTAHKAWSGGGAGFLALLFAPIGVEPDTTYTILVLLSALFSPWTGAAIDAELFQQAIKGLWMAAFAGAGVHQAVYWTPNKLKDLLPMAATLLQGISTTAEPLKPGDATETASDGRTMASRNIASIGLMLCSALVAAALLSGCSMVPYYSQVKAVADTGIATAIDDRREFNDKKLAVNLAALCDSSIGAVNRYPNGEVRDFVNRMCGGEPGITVDQLGRIAALLDAASGKQERIELAPPPDDPAEEPTS